MEASLTADQLKTSPRPESLSISPESSLTQTQTNGLAGQPSHGGHQSPMVDSNDGSTAPNGTLKSDNESIDNGKHSEEPNVHTTCQNIKEDKKTATATKRQGRSEEPCNEGKKQGVVKAKLEKRLSKLLTAFADKDSLYSGLDMSPSSPAGHDLPSLPSLKSTPDSQPPSLYSGIPTPEDEPLVQILSRVVSKDGKTPHGATPRGGVWTLRSQEGRLYLFNSQDREKEKDDDPEEEDTEEGIELSSLLAEENGESCAEYYHRFKVHIPTMILYCEVDNPHVTPVYTPSVVEQYSICRNPVGDDSGWILHHDAVFLVLQEDPPNDPIINAVQRGDLAPLLEKIEKEGKSFTNSTYNPVVNIKFEQGMQGNNMALYFNGKEYRYYVHVDSNTKELVAVRSQYSSKEDDWKNHLQFTNHYHSQDLAQPKAAQHDSTSTHGHDGGAMPVKKKEEKRMTTIDESDELAGQENTEGTDGEERGEVGRNGGGGNVGQEEAEMEKERKLEGKEGVGE